MIAWRVFLSGGVLLVSSLAVVDKAQAQQGYEFGIRFASINFRPTNFERFSFSGHGFRPTSAQPIQFNKINFPAFNSRAVRRDIDRSSDRGQSDRSIAFQSRDGRASRSDPSLRLSQRREAVVPILANRRPPESVSRAGIRHRLPENSPRLARRESDPSVSSRSSRIARSSRFVEPSSRAAKRRPAPTDVRSASRLRGEVFSSTAIR